MGSWDTKAPACSGYMVHYNASSSLCYMCGASTECEEGSKSEEEEGEA